MAYFYHFFVSWIGMEAINEMYLVNVMRQFLFLRKISFLNKENVNLEKLFLFVTRKSKWRSLPGWIDIYISNPNHEKFYWYKVILIRNNLVISASVSDWILFFLCFLMLNISQQLGYNRFCLGPAIKQYKGNLRRDNDETSNGWASKRKRSG